MNNGTRKFISSLGGYRKVSRLIGKKATTVHTHMQAGVFPAAWYDAFCQLAIDNKVEQPAKELFSFLQVSEGGGQ